MEITQDYSLCSLVGAFKICTTPEDAALLRKKVLDHSVTKVALPYEDEWGQVYYSLERLSDEYALYVWPTAWNTYKGRKDGYVFISTSTKGLFEPLIELASGKTQLSQHRPYSELKVSRIKDTVIVKALLKESTQTALDAYTFTFKGELKEIPTQMFVFRMPVADNLLEYLDFTQIKELTIDYD